MERSRSERRHNDWKHIGRKLHIVRFYWGGDDWKVFDEPYRLSKGKVHCSCGMCQHKTRTRGFCVSDLRKLAALESSFQELDDYEPCTRPGGHPIRTRTLKVG